MGGVIGAHIIMVGKYASLPETGDFIGGESSEFDEVAADVIEMFHSGWLLRFVVVPRAGHQPRMVEVRFEAPLP